MLASKLFSLGLILSGLVACPADFVGPIEMKGDQLDEAIRHLQSAFDQLAESEGSIYVVDHVYEASTFFVYGILDVYSADLVNNDAIDQCTVYIWRFNWREFNGKNLRVVCNGTGEKADFTWMNKGSTSISSKDYRLLLDILMSYMRLE